MDKAKLWESLCKPCSVTIERLADSIINQSRSRTTPRQHPYPSRKRSGDNEIYSCRLLRPKRKLQFSSDGITSLAYMLNDMTDDDPDERLFYDNSMYSDESGDESCQSSDVLRLTPNIDDDAISPAWKYTRKTRKLSETSEESEQSVNQQSIKQALSNLMAREEERRLDEEVKNINRMAERNEKIVESEISSSTLEKEIKIILDRVEKAESDDPLVLTWKLRNGFINHEELEKHLEVFLNEKPNESVDHCNMEFSFNKDFTGVLHAVDENKETEDTNNAIAGSSVEQSMNKTIEDDISETSSKIESQELPNANSQSALLSSTKSPKSRKLKKNNKWSANKKKPQPREKSRKLTPKYTILECRMCNMKCSSKEELATHLYSHTSSDLQETFAKAKQQQVDGSQKDKERDSVAVDSNDLEELIVSDDNAEVTNSADANSEILPSGTVINRRVSEDSDDIATVCSCHNNDDSQNGFSVQIEMVLFCATCKILFRRSECFETHYRVSRKCNENRGIGRTPKLFCSTCRVMLNTLSNMRRHLEEHANINFHGTVTFVCNICRVVFFGVGTVFCTHWFAHEKDPTFVGSKHGFPRLCISNNGVKPAGAKPREEYLFVAEYVCRSCKQQFSSESELSKHSENDCEQYLESKMSETTSAQPSSSNTTPKVVVLSTPKVATARVVAAPSPRVAGPPTPKVVSPPTPKVVSPPIPKVVASPSPKVVVPSSPKVVAPSNPTVVVPSSPKIVSPSSKTVPPSPKVLPPSPKVVPPSPKVVPPSTKEPTPPPSKAPSPASLKFPIDVNWICSKKSSYFLKLVSKWDCSFCQQSYDTWKDFEQHCHSHLQDNEYPGFYCTPQNSRAAYICNICRKLYNTFPDLMKHWASHDIIQLICTNCRIKFTTLIEFLHHMKRGCWRVKPGCRIQYLHQKFYCKICKIGFKGLDELFEHDSLIHKIGNPTKKNNERTLLQPSNVSNTSEIAIVNVTTDPTAFDTPADSVLYTLVSADDIEIVNDADSSQLQATLSDNKSIAVSSNVDNVDQPTLLMSLVYDDDGNYQLIPTSSEFEITKCDTTFQGSKVVSGSIPVINNNNEIIEVTPQQFIVGAQNIQITPKETTTIEEFQVVNYEQSVAEVDQPSVVDASKEDEKLINSERDTVITSALDPTESKSKEVKKLMNADESNAVTIDSSSDQDSEVLFDKVCVRSEKKNETETDTVAAKETTTVKADDEIQYVGSSPSKSASKQPRLRVKNFSELLAVKNYICQRCNAAFDNETSLTEHLTAHLNSLIGIGTTPTMRAALMLPSTAADTNTTDSQVSQQFASSVLSHMAEKRMLPTIPSRSHGLDARKATALIRTQGGDGFAGQNQLSASLPYSYPVYTVPYPKENELQQHSIVNATSNLNNISAQMALIPISQMNPGQLPHNTLAETGSIEAGGSVQERQRTYNCRVCRFVTTDRQYIVRHVRNHLSTNNQDQSHMNLTQSNINPVPQNAAAPPIMHQYHQSVNTANTSTQLQQIYNCNNQNINTNARNEFNNRYLSQQLTGYFCIQCRMYFESEEYLKSHMSQYHHAYCKNCRQRFKSYNDLADHICCPSNPWT